MSSANGRRNLQSLHLGLRVLRFEMEAARAQQIFALSRDVQQSRQQASLEAVVSGMPTNVSMDDRDHFSWWMLTEAGVDYAKFPSIVFSHVGRSKQMSQLTIIRFLDRRDKDHFVSWWTQEYKNTGKRLRFWRDGEEYEGGKHVLIVRPQIAPWDRLRSEPLKAAIKAVQSVAQTHPLKAAIKTSEIAVTWEDDALYYRGKCLLWVEFSIPTAVAVMYIDYSIFAAVQQGWNDAWAKVHDRDAQAGLAWKTSRWKSSRCNTYPFKITFARVYDWQSVYDFVKRKSDVCDSKSDVPPPDPAWTRGLSRFQ